MRAPADLNILIIDDDCEILERFTNFLFRRGYHVHAAENGVEGLQKLRENDIDIIFCDITMPQMDGVEFLDNMRKINIKAEIIMITGNSSVDKCVQCFERNVFAYLLKPLKLDEILENLHKAVQHIEEKQHMLKDALLASKTERANILAAKTVIF
ncbi:MAG: response regulator [Candidatus Omnitrophota bacterium]